MWLKKTIHLIFDHNMTIYKILSLTDSWANFVNEKAQRFSTHRKWASTLPRKSKKWTAADFQDTLHMRPQNSYCEIWGRLNISGVNHMTVKSENNAALIGRGSVMSANWSSRWLTSNMGCSRQSLMKLAPVNSIIICELVLVSDMDVFVISSLAYNFRTLYQIGGLQYMC